MLGRQVTKVDLSVKFEHGHGILEKCELFPILLTEFRHIFASVRPKPGSEKWATAANKHCIHARDLDLINTVVQVSARFPVIQLLQQLFHFFHRRIDIISDLIQYFASDKRLQSLLPAQVCLNRVLTA